MRVEELQQPRLVEMSNTDLSELLKEIRSANFVQSPAKVKKTQKSIAQKIAGMSDKQREELKRLLIADAADNTEKEGSS